MCEHCGESKVWGTPLAELQAEEGEAGNQGEGDSACEWLPDSPEATFTPCEIPPKYIVYDQYVEEHLCGRHRMVEVEEEEGGLGDFLQAIVLQESAEYRPIRRKEPCEFVADLLGEALEECGRPAEWARVIVASWILCPKHARKMGYKPPGGKKITARK